MAEFFPLSRVTYQDYLQGKSFLQDITEASSKQSLVISKDVRSLIANSKEIQQQGMQIQKDLHDREMRYLKGINEYSLNTVKKNNELVQHTNQLVTKGFEVLSYNLASLNDNVIDLSSQFRWGMGQALTQLGHINDTLTDLLTATKERAHTDAMEHFNSARILFEHKEYSDALKELNYAVNGVPGVSAPYITEWRIYKLLGIIRLGFFGCDISLVDLPDAEKSLKKAADFAKTDKSISEEAAKEAADLYVSAGWAAYCQGRLQECCDYTEEAVKLYPDQAEGYYQLAKAKLAMGNINDGLEELSVALDLDIKYSLKAAGDPDFQIYESDLKTFLESYGKKHYAEIVGSVYDFINTDVDNYKLDNLEDEIKQITGSNTLLNLADAEKRARKFIDNLKEYPENKRIACSRLQSNEIKLKELHKILNRIKRIPINISDDDNKFDVVLKEVNQKIKINTFNNLDECRSILTTNEIEFDKYISQVQKIIRKYYAEVIKNEQSNI
jgi:tetratricopeptide (TPR) repeat protein